MISIASDGFWNVMTVVVPPPTGGAPGPCPEQVDVTAMRPTLAVTQRIAPGASSVTTQAAPSPVVVQPQVPETSPVVTLRPKILTEGDGDC